MDNKKMNNEEKILNNQNSGSEANSNINSDQPNISDAEDAHTTPISSNFTVNQDLKSSQAQNIDSSPVSSTTTSTVPGPASSNPSPTTTSNSETNVPKKGNKTFFIILAIVILLTVIAIFLIAMNRSGSPDSSTQPPNVPTLQPIDIQPTRPLSSEEAEVEAIDLENPAPTDLLPVEEDLNSL